jgi:hypothetical protein
MNTMQVEITADIETLPDMRPEALESFRHDAATNFKAPSDMTKERACAELGMTDANEIKFTSKDRALTLWAERFKDELGETVAQANWRKTAFDGARGQICVIGLQADDGAPVSFYESDWEHPNAERRVLTEAFVFIADTYSANSMRSPVFIGHRIAGFDLPFMFKRAVILGIKPPSIIPFGAKPWDESIYDTHDRWCGRNEFIKLEALCAALGVAGKSEGMDGSQVADYVFDGRIHEVAQYCEGDVGAAYRAYRRMTFQPLPVEAPAYAESDLIPF